MDENCLFEIKNKKFIWLVLGNISIFLFPISLFLTRTYGYTFIFLTLITICLLVMYFFYYNQFQSIEFYSTALCIKKGTNTWINYSDIKAIKQAKKLIYLITNDHEKYNISEIHVDDEYYRLIGHNMTYTYNNLIKLAYTDLLYNKLLEFIGYKSLEECTYENSSSQKLFKTTNHTSIIPIIKYLIILISIIFISVLPLILLTKLFLISVLKLCFWFTIPTLLILTLRKLTKRTMEYEFYEDYILIKKSSSQMSETVNYSYITSIGITSYIKNTTCTYYIYYFKPDSKKINKISFETNLDIEQDLINLIRKSKNLDIE